MRRVVRLMDVWWVVGTLMVSITTGTVAAQEAPPAKNDQRSFQQWLEEYGNASLEAGIKPVTVERAFDGVVFNQRVIELNNRQPEFSTPVWQYLERVVTPERVERGQELMVEHRALLARIARHYGVSPKFVVAIWGLETRYGEVMGDFAVIEALATLGFEGRRRDYGRAQLLAALRILDQGHVTAENMLGSWAGAMGQTQFIPSTYLNYAVDFDGDGVRNLWTSVPDALASTAHYLQAVGWQPGVRWGREVRVPDGFDWSLSSSGHRKTVLGWSRLGVLKADGSALPQSDLSAELLIPAGHRGPTFLVYDNFRAIKRYNNSTAYALAVGYLADRIAGRGSIRAAWPRDLRPLNRAERFELQRRLAAQGLNPGEVDGILGEQTRRAARAFQEQVNLPPDGYPSSELLQHLRDQEATPPPSVRRE